MILKEAIRELRGNLRFVFLYILNIGIGLSGLVTMDAFRESIQNSVTQSQKQILSADLGISSRKPLPLKFDFSYQDQSESIELFTMVRSKSLSRLVSLKASSANFPLFGDIEFQDGSTKKMGSLPEGRAWIYPEVSLQLKIAIGDSLQLGDKKFLVDGIIKSDPSKGFRGFAAAGKIFISVKDLKQTNLLHAESTATYQKFFLLNPGETPNIVKKLEAQFTDPSIQFITPEKAGQDSSRILDLLSDFLGLSSLVALFLAALGAAYLFRTWILQRTSTMAIQSVLGLSYRKILLIPITQTILLSVLAVPLTLLFSSVELNLLSRLVTSFSPVKLTTSISPNTILLSVALSSITSLLLSLPFFARVKILSTRSLITGETQELKINYLFLYFIPAFLALFGLALSQAHSLKNTAIFLGGLCAAMFFFFVSGLLLLKFLRTINFNSLPWTIQHAVKFLSRKGLSSLAVFTAIALSSLLLNLLPQICTSLLPEIEKSTNIPSLFLFDIQEEQVEPLRKMLENTGYQLNDISPMVRSRLISVNNAPFERQNLSGNFRTREDETENRFRNRGFNLSYSDSLNYSEKLLEGIPFSKVGNQISVEKNFASRLGLKIGDKLKFDIQGVEIEGEIINLRKVKWTSFRPNFFIIFNSGPLDNAPKSFLGSIPSLNEKEKIEVQNSLLAFFPNVSFVDITDTIARAMELIDKLQWSLYLMAGISLFAGFIVLYSISVQLTESRRADLNICKILGASKSNIRSLIVYEFGLLSFFASSFGAGLSILFSFSLVYFIFDGSFRVNFLALTLSIICSTFISISIAIWACQSLWKRNPSELLN